MARQRFLAHGNACRLAKTAQRTAKLGRSAKPLPCDFRATHGKGGFAGRIFAGQSLSCKAARQRLCRADLRLCRAISVHGNVQFSRSGVLLFMSCVSIFGKNKTIGLKCFMSETQGQLRLNNICSKLGV
jgi:hypothetical protein